MNKKERKKIVFQITLIIMSIYFSFLENMIPKPFPWMKIGLANIASLIGMEKYGAVFGIEITVLRILIYGFMMGTFMTPNFFISFFSGIVSVVIMAILFKFKEKLSIVAISTAAGVVHNIMQLIVAWGLFFRNISIFEKGTIIFIEIFIVSGTLAGLITGVIALKYIGKKKLAADIHG